MLRSGLIILMATFIGACAMGEGGRWIGSDNRTVQVEGIPYVVQYVRSGAELDMRGVRTETIVMMPDAAIERRRNTAAALIVARDLCAAPVMVFESKDGDMYSTRVKCG